MKQIYIFLLVCLGLLLVNQHSMGQTFSHKSDYEISRTRSTSQYRTTVRFSDLFTYPEGWIGTEKLQDSTSVNIQFASTNDENLVFDTYYYSSYSGQFFYYIIPAGAYGNDTLTVTLSYNDFTAESKVITKVTPINCKNDAYTISIGDTVDFNVTSNDSPSAYYEKSTLEIIKNPTLGTATINEDYSLNYINSINSPNFSKDTILYRMADADGNYDTATVVIDIHYNSYVTKVFDFLPAPGQFVNTSWAMNSSAENIIGSTSSGVSLGGFGGYIVAGFDQPIVNRDANPYGVDFSVKGNAFGGWGEPAAVQVMKDENGNGLPDDTWYELAGSDYHFSTSVKNLTITYFNPKKNGRATLPFKTDKGFNGAMRTNSFHSQSYYPDPYDFGVSHDSVAYTGTFTRFMLDKSRANYITAKRLPIFGYADNKPNGSNTTTPTNPYADSKGNGFDLEWAVDKNGNPVELDTIHFVKVYSTVQEDGGWLGEVSPEIFEIGITTPDPAYQKEDFYVHAIGAGQLQVLKGSSFKYEGLLFKNGIPQTGNATWKTSVDSVGTIDNSGLFVAKKLGTTTLTFSADSNVDSATIDIEVVDLSSISIELEGNTTSVDSTSLIVGETIYLHAQAIDSRSSSAQFVYEDYNWTSSNPAIGTIDKGIFKGFNEGRTTVVASSVHNPLLADTVVVVVNEVPELYAVTDTVLIPYYSHKGTFTNSDLFSTGGNATVYIDTTLYNQALMTSSIVNNEMVYSIAEGHYGYETIDFVVTAYDVVDTITIVFNIEAPDNLASPKQIVFTNGGEFGNPNAPTEMLTYIPSKDTTIQIDNYLAGATSVQDMVVDGNYVYVTADYYITRYNASTHMATDSVYTQDLSETDADGQGADMSGLNHKLAIYENMLIATRQNSAAAPEDGYNVRIYNKGDLSLITKIPVSNQATDVVVVSDTAYVMINGGFAGTTSAMAIIDLNTLTLNREVDLGTTGLGVMQMIAKGSDIYCVRLSDFMSRYTSGIVVYNTLTSTTEEYEYTSGIPYDSSPLAIEPMTNDTLFIKKDLGYVAFDTNTKTFGEDKYFSIPAYYTQDSDHIGKGSIYDEETKLYYVAYAYWHGEGIGQIYDAIGDSVGTFKGVGASPEVIKIVEATESNEKPYLNRQYSRSYNEEQTFRYRISNAMFGDKEDRYPTFYMYNPKQFEWLTFDPSTRYLSGTFTDEVTEPTTFNVLMQAFDTQGAFVIDTFKLTINPVDDVLSLGDSIPDLDLDEDASDTLLILTNTFVDPDSEITFSIDSISNDTILNLNIEDNSLRISLLEEASGVTTVILKAESNGVVLTDTFTVTVNEIDDAPIAIGTIANIADYASANDSIIELDGLFDDIDSLDPFTYKVLVNSDSTVAIVTIDGSQLSIDFIAAGQTNVSVQATSGGQTASVSFVIGVYPSIDLPYGASDFENLELAEESYWNGADNSGGFVSGEAAFKTSYTIATASWNGWGYSNTSDTETASWLNQYSAITGAGFDTIVSDGKNYGVAFITSDLMTGVTNPLPLSFADSAAHRVNGFYVTNSTYAALSMQQGDAFAKKFGGEDGTDPDYFKLVVYGLKDGAETDTVEFYLADFRFEDDTKDYIVQSWQWVDLSELGKVDQLMFNLESSDVGMWGINTPLYFNIDNMYIAPDLAPEVINPIADVSAKEIAPDQIIDLSNVFTDADDETVTISLLSNSNPEFASATLSATELNIDFIAEGITILVVEGRSNNKSVFDTIQVTVITDLAPEVGNPIADISVVETANDTIISLENVFTDMDDDDVSIMKSIASNSSESVVLASIDGDELSLSYLSVGEAEIVIEASSNGLTVTDTILVNVSPVTNIKSKASANVVLYPNPSNGFFRVNTNLNENVSVRIFTLSGSLVYENKSFSSKQLIDMSDKPSGQYIIQMNKGDFSYRQSLIIK